MDPKDVLRHHVTGAIERGEAEAIVEKRAVHPTSGRPHGWATAEPRPIKAFDIEAHGVDHAQYFQGAGVMFTDFDEAHTGAGANAQEAYENAVDDLAQCDWDVSKLPRSESALRRRGLLKSDSVSAFIKSLAPNDAEDDTADESECELYYYVTIRVRGA